MKKILDELRADPRIAKVRLSVNQEQVAAKKMYEALGFREIGIARKEIKIGNRYHDQSQMELIFEDKL